MQARAQRIRPLRRLLGSVVALSAAALFATTALANGEPKNQPPFTTIVAQNNLAIAGEPKNELPFTKVSKRTIPAPDWFERYAAAHPYGANLAASASPTMTSVPGGFRWRDALIGAAATLALILILAGLGLVRSSHRRSNPILD
jgi:hypothetical protein